MNFIDLFAGAGGLSEGFMRAGFIPIAHVEIDTAACNTLKTRMAYHWLKKHDKLDLYYDYLNSKISRSDFYQKIPEEVINSVINLGIGEENNPKIFKIIDEIPGSKDVDLIIGGPPCQAYSIAGRSRDKKGMKGDPRNHLYKYYAEYLKKYMPKYFVFENVLGLLSARDEDGQSYFELMKALFRKIGYEIKYKVLDTSDYGIPQKRKRIILVGKLGGTLIYPEPRRIKTSMTISEFFSDLPRVQAGQGSSHPVNYHQEPHPYVYDLGIRDKSKHVTWQISRPNNDRDLEIYRIVTNKWINCKERLSYNDLPARLKTHNNTKHFLDRFKLVAPELYASHTVVAHISKDGHYYIHPDIIQNRSITPREAARLQTFPDNYYFEGVLDKPSRTSAYKQIGNAVPVVIGEKIAQELKKVW